jgi:hypothetical protein
MMAVVRKLNYQHLLCFWSVVRTGSLTRACEELVLSAPTISAQLRTLEARLGEKLLTKAGRTLVPSEVGRLVYGYADEIFGLGRDLVDALEHRPTRRPLRVIVGIDDVVPREIALRLLAPALGLLSENSRTMHSCASSLAPVTDSFQCRPSCRNSSTRNMGLPWSDGRRVSKRSSLLFQWSARSSIRRWRPLFSTGERYLRRKHSPRRSRVHKGGIARK